MPKYNLVAYQSMQKREIDEHKYFLSQKAGYDVGYEIALTDWVKFHARRFEETYFEHFKSISKVCKKFCNEKCKGIDGCVLSSKSIHELLED